jgi:hypothetical protein
MKNLNLFNTVTAYNNSTKYYPNVAYITDGEDVKWEDLYPTVSFTTNSGSSVCTFKINGNTVYNQATYADSFQYTGGSITSLANFAAFSPTITSIDASQLDTTNTTTIASAFDGCLYLTDVSSIKDWKTNSLVNIAVLFRNCQHISTLDVLASWNLSGLTTVNSLFYGCAKLETLDVSTIDPSLGRINSYYQMFTGCNSLKTVYVKNAAAQTWFNSRITECSIPSSQVTITIKS